MDEAELARKLEARPELQRIAEVEGLLVIALLVGGVFAIVAFVRRRAWEDWRGLAAAARSRVRDAMALALAALTVTTGARTLLSSARGAGGVPELGFPDVAASV